jgi:hypothetical protein
VDRQAYGPQVYMSKTDSDTMADRCRALMTIPALEGEKYFLNVGKGLINALTCGHEFEPTASPTFDEQQSENSTAPDVWL